MRKTLIWIIVFARLVQASTRCGWERETEQFVSLELLWSKASRDISLFHWMIFCNATDTQIPQSHSQMEKQMMLASHSRLAIYDVIRIRVVYLYIMQNGPKNGLNGKHATGAGFVPDWFSFIAANKIVHLIKLCPETWLRRSHIQF